MSKVQIEHDTREDAPCLIGAYIHCAKCLEERPKHITPQKWARTQAGYTDNGIQIWCTRHDVNIDTWKIEVRS